MMTRSRPQPAAVALALAVACSAALGAGRAAPPPPAKPADRPTPPETARAALQRQLDSEKAELARLEAQLARLRTGRVEPGGPAPTTPAARPTTPAAEPASAKTPAAGPASAKASAAEPPKPATPLVARPSLGAADVLYRLGRWKQARAVYEALLAMPKRGSAADRVWARLRAGTCCRRLGDFDAALEHFQAIPTDDTEGRWSEGHVAWALRIAQWEKNWHHLEQKRGE